MSFRDDLERVLNQNSAENESDTPDFILRDFVIKSLDAFDSSVNARDKYWDHKPWAAKKQPGV